MRKRGCRHPKKCENDVPWIFDEHKHPLSHIMIRSDVLIYYSYTSPIKKMWKKIPYTIELSVFSFDWEFTCIYIVQIKLTYFQLTPVCSHAELPICPIKRNKVSLASKWTKARIWLALPLASFLRPFAPDAPLMIILKKKRVFIKINVSM